MAARSGASWGILGILTGVCRPASGAFASGDDEQRPYVASGMLTSSCPGAFLPVPEAMPSRGGSYPLPGPRAVPGQQRGLLPSPLWPPTRGREATRSEQDATGAFPPVPREAMRRNDPLRLRGSCLLPGDATLHGREITSADTGTPHGQETASVWTKRRSAGAGARIGGRTVSSKALPTLRGASARPCRSSASKSFLSKISPMPVDCPHGRHLWGTNRPPVSLTSGDPTPSPRGHPPCGRNVVPRRRGIPEAQPFALREARRRPGPYPLPRSGIAQPRRS